MALDHEIEAMAAQAERDARKLKRRLLGRRSVAMAYRRLFLDPVAGDIKPEAIEVIADFSSVALLGVADIPAMPDDQLRDRAGRRALALHILARIDLDGSALRDLASKLRENDHA